MSEPLAQTLRRAPAPLAFMGLIFYLSSQPDLSTGLGTWDFVLRKLAHITEYGLLAALAYWALHPSARPPLYRALPLAGAIALAYAATDEYHQTFVEGRHGTPSDLLFDLVGIVLAAALVRHLTSRGAPARSG